MAGKKEKDLRTLIGTDDLEGPVKQNLNYLDKATSEISDTVFDIQLKKQNKSILLFDSLLDSTSNPPKAKQTAYLVLRGVMKTYPDQEVIPSFSLQVCEKFVHFGYYYEFVSEVRRVLLSQEIIIEFQELDGSTKYKLSPFFYDLYDSYCGTKLNKDDVFTEKDLDIILQLQKLKTSVTKIALFYGCSTNTINYWIKKVKQREGDLTNVAGVLADLESLEIEHKNEKSNVISDDAIMRRGTMYFDKITMAVLSGGISAVPVKDYILVQKEYVNLKTWYEAKQKLKEIDMLDECMAPGEVQEILKQAFKTMGKEDVIEALNVKDPEAKKILTDALIPYDMDVEGKVIEDLITQDILKSQEAKKEADEANAGDGSGASLYRF